MNKIMKIKITVTETFGKNIEINAKSYEEAKRKVIEKYQNEKIVLDYINDFIDVFIN